MDENTRVRNEPIGVPVDATDDDGHRLTYTLEGVHKDLFTIERSGSGHIRTKREPDYEERRSYSLTVTTAGGPTTARHHVGHDRASGTKDESPTTPGEAYGERIAGSTSDVVRVNWEPPTNPGPPIVDYDVQYRDRQRGLQALAPRRQGHEHDHHGAERGHAYEVQVRAWNMEDESEWSLSGRGSPDADPANNAPVYTGGVRNFTVEENTGAGVNIGTPVQATDSDDDDLTYSLEGADSASFEIVSVSGQIQTKAGRTITTTRRRRIATA